MSWKSAFIHNPVFFTGLSEPDPSSLDQKKIANVPTGPCSVLGHAISRLVCARLNGKKQWSYCQSQSTCSLPICVDDHQIYTIPCYPINHPTTPSSPPSPPPPSSLSQPSHPSASSAIPSRRAGPDQILGMDVLPC